MSAFHEANGARFIAASDMIVGWCRKTGQAFEPETTAWMFDVMERGAGAFIDVGASTGWFSIPVALRGHEVHAFEPNPLVAARLRENAELNGATVNICEAAVSGVAGDAVLYHNHRLPLTSGASLSRTECLAPTGQTTVRTITLDGALSTVPALIKIDVEGCEIGALEGARRILERRPHLMLEANTPDHAAALRGWLGERYDVTAADGRNMLCSPRS